LIFCASLKQYMTPSVLVSRGFEASITQIFMASGAPNSPN
jgi:hypothetical protein